MIGSERAGSGVTMNGVGGQMSARQGGTVTLNNNDTMAFHPDWTEQTAYSEGSRGQWVLVNPAATRRLG